jgi:MFS family permease
LIGRRYVALAGAGFVCIGMVITGTAQRMEVAIAGMAIAGVGAGFGELVAAAGVAELAPVKNRGYYIGAIFLLILPFSASAAYGNISRFHSYIDFLKLNYMHRRQPGDGVPGFL